MKVISTEPRLCAIAGAALGDGKMVFSPFLYKVDLGEKVLLTNTFTRFYCQLTPKEAQGIEPGTVVDRSWLDQLSTSDRQTFIENRIIIDAETDEHQTYLDVYGFLDDILKSRVKIDRYNILTTNGCNARCYYCFEEGYYPKVEHMSMETADKVAKYIIDTHDSDNKIYLRWFGGEPLVNTKVIDHISTKLTEAGIDYYSTMSTNGLLCTEKVINSAVTSWRMSKIRITLDGWGEEHNRRKRFPGVRDGFTVIMRNIDNIVKSGIIMVVRLSVDRDNLESLIKLCDHFIEKYQGVPNFKMYAHCLHDDVSDKTRIENAELFNSVRTACDILTHRILKSGMYDCERLQPNGFRMYLCAAQDPTKVSITPSGGVCRCECLSNDSVTWGNVDGKVTNQTVYDHWHKDTNKCREKCKSCFMLPLCTPYSICPLSYISCKERFENTLKKYLIESSDRWEKGQPPIDLIDCIPFDISFED